jgi:hypothetical protein
MEMFAKEIVFSFLAEKATHDKTKTSKAYDRIVISTSELVLFQILSKDS